MSAIFMRCEKPVTSTPSEVKLHTHCMRCGECCLRSSPTLQAEDLHLIEAGRILKQNLMTLRRGELVTDIVQGFVGRAPEEMIKVKEKKGDGAGCLFYEGEAKACAVYNARPLQCRALKCWDSREILGVLGRPKLRRRDVIQNSVLLGLIEAHEKRCAYDAVEDQVRRIPSEGDKAVQGLLDMLKFDYHLRPFVSQKLQVPLDEMDFFLGRPLLKTITIYGLKVIKAQDGSFFLTKVSEKEENGMLE